MADECLPQKRSEWLFRMAGKQVAVHALDLAKSFEEIALLNRALTGCHLIQDQAQGKHVAHGAGRYTTDLLRRHIARRAGHTIGPRGIGWLGLAVSRSLPARKAEIHDLDEAGRGNHDVG